MHSTTDNLMTKGVTIAFTHPTPRGPAWACADHPRPELFHPADEAALHAAQAVCAGCPAKALCLELGLLRQEYGVWGGVLLEDGKPLPTVRRPGRPRKVA